MKQKSQNLGLLLLQGLDCLTLLCLYLFILHNELIMLSFPSFPFIVFFLQVFWSKFAILLKFFRIKRIKTNHFWTTPSTMSLSPVSLSSCTSRFLPLQIFPLLFFHFLSFLFFVFDIIWLSFLSVCSSNLSVMSSRSCYFQNNLHPLRRYLWFLVLFLTSTFSWGY